MWITVGRLMVVSVAALVILTGGGVAFGQTVVDATAAEFAPSADHAVLSANGTPVLARYVLDILRVGSSTPLYSIDLSKPSPDADGLIRVQFASLLPTPLVGGDSYQARVWAIGPGGSAVSALSNPFASSAPCAPVLSAISTSLGSAASTGSITVNAGAACGWTATSNASWLTITSAMPATGTASVRFAATANTATQGRSGTLTIAGQTVTIAQSAAACTYAINPASRTVATPGETGTVGVTASNGCRWTASTSTSWLTVTAGATGTGNGTVTVRVAANSSTTERTGTVAIAGRTYSVTQRGTCAFTVTPASVAAPPAGTTSSFTIGTTSTCSWSATGIPTWISMSSGSRSGSGTLSFTISANNEAARSVMLTIAGKSIMVNQGAAPLLPPTNFRIVKSPGGNQ